MAERTGNYLIVRGRVTDNSAIDWESSSAVVALAFAPGKRPGSDAILDLSRRQGLQMPFAVTHAETHGNPWLELLTGGLAFDCRGLAPGGFAVPSGEASLLGLAKVPRGETVTLEPAPHLAEGRGLLPVVRAMAGLAAVLCELPGIVGVYWRPARCWMAPKYFSGVVHDWLAGGPFPALGLTSLYRLDDGTMVSVGLDYLIGQELLFASNRRLASAALARIAVRLVNDLVGSGPLQRPATLRGPEGELIEAVPTPDGRQLQVSITM